MSTTFTDTEVNNCFSIYHTSEKAGCKVTFLGQKIKKVLFKSKLTSCARPSKAREKSHDNVGNRQKIQRVCFLNEFLTI